MCRFLLLFCLMFTSIAQASFLDKLSGDKQSTFLSPDQAFKLTINSSGDDKLLANFTIAQNYYLYRDKIHFAVKSGNSTITQVNLPPGEIKNDPNFGEIQVFHRSFQAEIQLDRADTSQPLTLNVSYQGCSDKGLCYPPIEKQITVNVIATLSATPAKIPPTIAPENENNRIAQLFQQGSFWLIVSFFFGAGLLLAFTPCVFPMIPILSGIIVGRGHNITHAHAFLLSLSYVLGMAITYAVAGIAAGLSGELISNALQTPWMLGSFALIFVVLSLSMFGFYELQLPSALQSRLTETSNKLHGGHLSGVFLMGALSAIIMSPCVAAPMAGALLYIGQTHDAVLGGTALFMLALGMGAPLLLIGTSAGTLLPKAGAWMESVKRFFGVIMLALAIWIMMPIMPIALQMGLWGALFIFCGIYLHALDKLPSNANGWHKLSKGFGVIAFLCGIAYLVGALSGAQDLLQPLAAINSNKVSAPSTLHFERIKTSAELDARIAQAQGHPVMLDFYADWCVSCKEMERYTFSNATVQAKLKNIVVLQADVTANDADDKFLLQRFQLFGPPAILFFNSKGVEASAQRVIGYQNAEQFTASLAVIEH